MKEKHFEERSSFCFYSLFFLSYSFPFIFPFILFYSLFFYFSELIQWYLVLIEYCSDENLSRDNE